MRNFKLFPQMLALLTGLLFFAGCQQDEIATPNSSIGERGDATFSTYSAPSRTIFGLGTENQIYKYNTNPVELQNVAPLKGLRPGERMLAMDYRSSNGILYGLSSLDILYKIDPISGIVTAVGQLTTSLDGTEVGFDFIPKEDRISVMTNTGQVLKIDPNTGAVVGSTTVSPTTTQVGVNALAHSFGTATSQPTMYYIDTRNGKLLRFDQSGNAVEVGPTGMITSGDGGFDIAKDDTAFATYYAKTEPGEANAWDEATVPEDSGNKLFIIDLKSGDATSLGTVRPMIGMAIR